MIGKKISLRAMEPQDVDTLYIWENAEETWRVSDTQAPFSRFALEQYVLNTDQDIFSTRQLRLMVDLLNSSGNNITIGNVDLFDFSPAHRRAGVGILIAGEYRRKGYASEALDLLIDYTSGTLNLHQLYCNISSDNAASLDLFRRKGFEIVGIKKDWLLSRGQWRDEILLQKIFQ